MEITWYGWSCFKLAERGTATVVTDPYARLKTGPEPIKMAADIITFSHPVLEANGFDALQGTPYLINGPGEYEVGGVFITGIQMGGQKSSPDGQQSGSRNTLYVFDFNALTVAHLGDLNRIPTQAEVEAIGTVNVALVPVGEGHALNAAQAAEVIGLLEPNLVVPVYETTVEHGAVPESLSKFLKEMGITEVETFPSLKVSSASLPEETKVVVLDYQKKV